MSSEPRDPNPTGDVLDLRAVPLEQAHRMLLERYVGLAVEESVIVVDDHDPLPLREELERELPGAYGWEYVRVGPASWRVRVTKLATTPLPRIVGDTGAFDREEEASGAVWRLGHRERDLDSNLIRIPSGGRIEDHAGPALDVLWVVLAGSGTLRTEIEPVPLSAGKLVWLPARSRRGVDAGPDGLGYLTVHRRRDALQLGAPAAAEAVPQRSA